MLEFTDYIKLFVGMLAIVNPVGAIPIFISMTATQNNDERLQTTNLVAIGVCSILMVALLAGELLLTFFGITIDSFRVGGGILVLLMAIAMLQAKTSEVRQTHQEADESMDKDSVAIVPLAMPLLAGPGAISTVILAAHKAHSITHYIIMAFSILVLSLSVWVALRMTPWVKNHVSETGINIFTRIMGLILAAIAIEFIANGVKGLFPVLA